MDIFEGVGGICARQSDGTVRANVEVVLWRVRDGRKAWRRRAVSLAVFKLRGMRAVQALWGR